MELTKAEYDALLADVAKAIEGQVRQSILFPLEMRHPIRADAYNIIAGKALDAVRELLRITVVPDGKAK